MTPLPVWRDSQTWLSGGGCVRDPAAGATVTSSVRRHRPLELPQGRGDGTPFSRQTGPREPWRPRAGHHRRQLPSTTAHRPVGGGAYRNSTLDHAYRHSPIRLESRLRHIGRWPTSAEIRCPHRTRIDTGFRALPSWHRATLPVARKHGMPSAWPSGVLPAPGLHRLANHRRATHQRRATRITALECGPHPSQSHRSRQVERHCE